MGATVGAQWLSGRVLDSRPKGRGFEPHRRHCVVSLSKNINPSLVLVQPRKIRPFITERLLMGRKESNQTNMSPHLLHSNTNQYNINGLLCTYTEMFRIQPCCIHILSAAEGFRGQKATCADPGIFVSFI